MNKFKSVAVIIAMIFCVALYVYINNLNNTIVELNHKIVEQSNQIVSLNQNISSLEKELNAVNSTLELTDEYIEYIEKIKTDEDVVKQAIFEEVLNDESDEIKIWLNQKLPDNLRDVLNTNMVNRVCRD